MLITTLCFYYQWHCSDNTVTIDQIACYWQTCLCSYFSFRSFLYPIINSKISVNWIWAVSFYWITAVEYHKNWKNCITHFGHTSSFWVLNTFFFLFIPCSVWYLYDTKIYKFFFFHKPTKLNNGKLFAIRKTTPIRTYPFERPSGW